MAGSASVSPRGAAIELRQPGSLPGVGDDQPAPLLGVPTPGGRLDCDPDALLDHLRLNGTLQIEPLAHRARRGEEPVDLGKIELGHGPHVCCRHRHLRSSCAGPPAIRPRPPACHPWPVISCRGSARPTFCPATLDGSSAPTPAGRGRRGRRGGRPAIPAPPPRRSRRGTTRTCWRRCPRRSSPRAGRTPAAGVSAPRRPRGRHSRHRWG